MKPQTILILQGGGAYGAYECGVYKALAPHLDQLAVVAGTSIGAINASVIAHHYQTADHGAGYLQAFWNEVLATPSLPFFPPLGDWRRWDAVWTSLLAGHPHLFTPRLPAPWPWMFQSPIFWSETHFYRTQAMEQTVHDAFGAYGPRAAAPRLIVTAVDIEEGKARVFDSWQERITAAQVVACGSLPPGFPAKEIAGKFYWDGGLWSNTPLPEVLNALQAAGPREERYQVYIIDVFPKQGQVPQTNWEVWQRISELSYADKTAYDKKASEWVNKYIDLVNQLKEVKSQLPPAVAELVQEHIPQVEKRIILDITPIARSAFPDEHTEHISREGDFSPERIKELMQQGYEDASQVVSQQADTETRPV